MCRIELPRIALEMEYFLLGTQHSRIPELFDDELRAELSYEQTYHRIDTCDARLCLDDIPELGRPIFSEAEQIELPDME